MNLSFLTRSFRGNYYLCPKNTLGITMNNHNKPKLFTRSALSIACSAALLFTSASHAATVEGRVTNPQNSVFFEGAQIRIVELNLTTVSERNGAFRFANVEAGQYTLEISYIGAPKTTKLITVVENSANSQQYVIGNTNKKIENLIVYGQRAGQAGALNRQRNADNLKSIASADSIGQLPDQNAAEALQHLPGLSIQRDQGEGRFVAIRGIDPNLNNVTINGVNVPSPEAGIRSVAMDVIPSELVQSLEVSKTVTPDMDASAVGGSVEVKSLSAFDRNGQSYSATAQSSYNEMMEETSPKLSGSYSNIFALSSGTELGVATALSWYERSFGSHNMETDGGWGEFEYEDVHSSSGNEVERFGTEEIEQRHYTITRERLGAAINLDLHTSSTDKYYLRTLYSRFSDDEFRLRNEYKFAKGAIDLTQSSDSSAQFMYADMDRDTKDRYEEQEIMSIVVGGENQLDTWLVEYNFGYSKSSEIEPNRVDVDFSGGDFDLGYNNSGEIPQLSQSASAHDLSSFELDEVIIENNTTEDEETSFKVDLSRDFTWQNNNGQVKFGTKYRSREKFNDVNLTIYDGGFNDALASQFAAASPDYDLGNFGPGISRDQLHSFVMNNRAQFDVNTNESMIENSGLSNNNQEDIFAAYAMVTLDINDWHIVTGLRYEATEFSTVGNKVELVVDEVNDSEAVNVTPWAIDKDYNHLLPSLNVRYNATDNIIARFALTQTIARPTFGDAAAYQLIESEITNDDGVVETERKAEVGNPDLEPYESSNIDFAVEYYPENIGVLSAGIFYKDIDNFIIQQEVQDNGQWDGYDEVVQPVNGGSASLTGVEFAWTKNFDSGLFINTNATFIDADDKLPNQADTIGNVILGFENNDISMRLSATHKSENYQFDDGDASVYENTHQQLDFSGKYYITDTMQVYFNAVNLTDEPMHFFHGKPQYNYQFEQYGRSFEIGFTITSL